MARGRRPYNGVYEDEHLDRVAFPLGGMGAGMLCLEGAGGLSHFSVRGTMEFLFEPAMYSALWLKGVPKGAKVLEGPVARWKVFGPPGAAGGRSPRMYGLPRFDEASFMTRFPFGRVALRHRKLPVRVELTGWSPFIPLDADNSSLPVAALEYRFTNASDARVEGIYSFHAANMLTYRRSGSALLDAKLGRVRSARNGFILWQPGTPEKPADEIAFSASVDDPDARVNCAWFRGGWFDSLTMCWKTVAEGAMPEAGSIEEGDPSPGGSLYVPFALEPGEEKLVVLRLAWYAPKTELRMGEDPQAADENQCGCGEGSCCGGDATARAGTHRPWYAAAFPDIAAVTEYWRSHYAGLREASERFSECLYDSTLPPEVIEAVAGNLTILKSPTVQRQADGRLWCWEGCHDDAGCCFGSCTHVWNYAQALPHLFPDMERSLRHTEFQESQDERGHQAFRSNLPIRPRTHDFHAAADGQLGGIMKVHREWRIGGDTDWLRRLWPRVKQSLDYCIETWDPDHRGAVVEPHHNTYDIEFWGPDGMCTSFYLGALQAALNMAQALEEETPLYAELLTKGRALMESELWNGEYFIQRIEQHNLHAGDPTRYQTERTTYSPEALELLGREGPKYQYGGGCLSDGVLGAWMGAMCGIGDFLDRSKVDSHLRAVFRHNFREDLSEHANPQRPTYALGEDAGLLLCSWPRGGALTLPFVYSDEVWTGIEYQVATHLMWLGHVTEGLQIVRAARDRYDGRVRNPFDEYECGHWYARAMSSYGLLQGLIGARYDAVERTLYLAPRLAGDFRAFLCTATGFGMVGVQDGKPFVEVRSGAIPYEHLVYEPF